MCVFLDTIPRMYINSLTVANEPSSMCHRSAITPSNEPRPFLSLSLSLGMQRSLDATRYYKTIETDVQYSLNIFPFVSFFSSLH
jgi:hypothetical protein